MSRKDGDPRKHADTPQISSITRRASIVSAIAAACMPAEARAQAPDPRPHDYELLNQPAPPFSLNKLGGGVARLSDYRSKVLTLYFGGLWCPDCLRDGPYVNALAHEIANDPHLAFLNINTRNRFGRWGGDIVDPTPAQAQAALNAYFAETGYSYAVAFDPTRTFAHETYAIAWSPTYLLIDRRGVIRGFRTDLGDEGGATLLAQARNLERAG